VQKILTIPIVLLSLLVLVSSSNSNYGYFGFAKVVYGQSNPNQVNSNTTSSVNIQDIPLKKVHVGDIDIAYKTFGKGQPFLLISGAEANMYAWVPSTLKNLSTNHTVIVFDNRGVGNTTTAVAQQLIVTHPEKVNRLLLVAASCGGKESIPQSPQVAKFAYEMIHKSGD
jgi:hypothetical protein